MTTCHYCGTDCSGKQELTVAGTRQAGKTHVLVMLAVEEAALRDGKVAFIARSRPEEEVRFEDCFERARWLYPDKIVRGYRGHANRRIVFKGGGEIKFGLNDFRGFEFDLCCYDDAPVERLVHAKRSIRSLLW